MVFYAAYIFTYVIGTGESAKGSKTQRSSTRLGSRIRELSLNMDIIATINVYIFRPYPILYTISVAFKNR